MNKNTCLILAAISAFLYSILGFVKEAIEKYLLAILTESGASFANTDFVLNIKQYMNILLLSACVFFALAIGCLIYELKKK